MTPDHDYLSEAVQISRELAEARAEVATIQSALARAKQLRAKLAPAIWDAYHIEGRTAPDIAQHLVGVSHDTVRRIVGNRKKPTPRPG